MRARRSRRPKIIGEIAECIGEDRALHLVRHTPQCGKRARRRTIYVPQKLVEDHPLVEILGPDDAQALSRAFGGEILELGVGQYYEKKERHRKIQALASEGLSPNQIGSQLNISTRTVRAYLARVPEDLGNQIRDCSDGGDGD